MKRKYRIIASLVLCLFVLALGSGRGVFAQSTNVYEFALEDIDYDDVKLSRNASQRFYFGLPEHWEALDGSYLDLDFEFATALVRPSEEARIPTARLEVYFNDELVHTEDLFLSRAYSLRVELPARLFHLPGDESTDRIEVRYLGYEPCESELSSFVRIRARSRFHLVYQKRPLQIDLADFPRPIYQYRALGPTAAYFVLPDGFDGDDVRAAAVVASRLGQLTNHRVAISATLASGQPAPAELDTNLIVVGTPDDNPLIGQLALPVPLVERQLALRSRMPMTVSVGSTLSYTLSVENTTSRAQTLVVEDRFAPVATFLGCGELCEEVGARRIRWDVGRLTAGESASMTVSLQMMSVISRETQLRHTATLFDAGGRVLNVDTLAAAIDQELEGELIASPSQKSTRFFVQDSQAVPEDAGVIQGLVSPWNADRAAFVITGLNDDALVKSSHGLNPWNHFPGPSGESAIVADIRSKSDATYERARDVTLASLGYRNEELNILDLESVTYFFSLPPGLNLGQDSYLALHFAHAAVASTVGGGIKITLNGVPIGTVRLDDSNLHDSWLRVSLNGGDVLPGRNRLRVETTVTTLDRCMVRLGNPCWLEVYDDSFLHFEYEPTQGRFDLGIFPYPFNSSRDMANVLFVLPDRPSVTDVEGVLRLASLFGGGADGRDFAYEVVFGGDFDLSSPLDYHIIAVGLPTANPVIRSVNARLPISFLPDSNEIYQSIDTPIYGIPPGTDLGIVQELVSPWDSEQEYALLVATGTTEKGVQSALLALTQSSQDLRGNVAIVHEDEIHSADTRPATAAEVFTMTMSLTPAPTGMPGQVASETPTPPSPVEQSATPVVPTSEPSEARASSGEGQHARPGWLLPLLVASLLTVVVAVIWLIRRSR